MTKKLLNRERLFLVFAFLLLTLSFSLNPFKITDDNYRLFDRGDESNIISRVMMSRDGGILSHGGMTGAYFFHQYHLEEGEETPHILTLVDGDTAKLRELDMLTLVAQSFDDYIKNRKIYGGQWTTYKTQPGGQALIYVCLDQILPFDNGIKLTIFRLITIMLSVLMFILILKWIHNNWGFVTALTAFILIFLSPWLFRFAYHLWWALWSYYIPFVVMLFVLDKKRREPNSVSDSKVFFLLFLTVFIKFFFTGAEFITSTLVMTVCPVIFYLIATNVELKSGVIYFIKSSVASILGVLAGMLMLIGQIRLDEGSWKAGVDHIIYSFVKRSAYADGFESVNPLDVIWGCFTDDMFYYPFSSSFSISFGLFLLIVSVLSIFVYCWSKIIGGEVFQRNKALVLTTAISVLGPLSWFVIFVQHVYIHYIFDPIVWYMPYFVYGFCIVGVFVQMVINKGKMGKQNIKECDREC